MGKESKFDGTPLSGAHISPELSKFLANLDTGAMKGAQGTQLADILDGTPDLGSGAVACASIVCAGALSAQASTIKNITGVAAQPLLLKPVAAQELQLAKGDGTVQLKVDDTGLGFFGVPAVAQQADAGALADNTTGAVDGALGPIGATNGGDESGAINANFADLAAKVNAIRDALRALGLMA